MALQNRVFSTDLYSILRYGTPQSRLDWGSIMNSATAKLCFHCGSAMIFLFWHSIIAFSLRIYNGFSVLALHNRVFIADLYCYWPCRVRCPSVPYRFLKIRADIPACIFDLTLDMASTPVEGTRGPSRVYFRVVESTRVPSRVNFRVCEGTGVP